MSNRPTSGARLMVYCRDLPSKSRTILVAAVILLLVSACREIETGAASAPTTTAEQSAAVAVAATAVPPPTTPSPTSAAETGPIPSAPAKTPTPTTPMTQTPAATPTPTPTATPPPTTVPPTPVAVLQLPNVADIVERVRPAVVSIVAEFERTGFFGSGSSFGSGTGVIFDSAGLVLTSSHVVAGSESIAVTLDDGVQVPAEIVGADLLSDLAVLRIEGDGYQAMPLKQNPGLRVGDWVVAIGNALALPGGPTVTVGVVSALGRSIEATPGITLYDLIQTDTVINPGNSGGPLIGMDGSLVGINTLVRRASAAGTRVEGIGFAINTETAAEVALQLVELGRVRWAWMGVILTDLAPDVAAQVGLPIREGVIIQNVVRDGPADQAGIHPGDIVMSVDGHKVAAVADLIRLLRQEFSAGQEIDLELFREDGVSTFKMTLGERPAR